MQTGRKIKVLQIVHSLPRSGGLERVVYHIATRLDKQKFHTVVCCLVKKGAFSGEFQKKGVEVVYMGGKSQRKTSAIFLVLMGFFNFPTFLKLFFFIRKNRFDIVHTHMFYAGVLGRLAARLAGSPLIFHTIHSSYTWKKNIHHRIDKWLAGYTYKIVAVNSPNRDFTIKKTKIPSAKFITILNGIDLPQVNKRINIQTTRRKLGIDSSSSVIGYVGSLEKIKGIGYLISAAPEVLQVRPEAKVLIVGDGELMCQLQKTVRELGIENSVIFLGWRSDIHILLAIMDLFVCPAVQEGVGIATAEAMAMKKPVILTPTYSMPQLLENGITAMLIPPKDHHALAQGILDLLEDQDKAVRIGIEACKRIEKHFSITRMIRDYENLYLASLLQKKFLPTFAEGFK
ncbi:MAG: glycosyltransferase [Candidatus Scalindua sp.]